MPSKLILVRHGQTDYNLERRMQGWLDIPLNQRGHQQARETAQSLASTKIDLIYSSDLQRAHQTASHLATELSVQVSLTPALRERDMGIFSGWRWEHERDEVKDKLWEEFVETRDQEDLTWNKHQGESVGQLTERLNQFVQTLHSDHRDQTIVLVTHGGTVNRILELFQVKPAQEGFKTVKNASTTTLIKITPNKYVILD